MKLGRLGAVGGIAGPVLFTTGWIAGTLRQAAPPAEVQLSGLAADDARDPQLMMAAFVVLGVCSIGFGAALRPVTGPRSAGRWLVLVAGAATVAAGVFRRDHLLLTGPGFTGESWPNQVHDVVSGVAYAAMLAAPLLLARRLRREPGWQRAARAVTGLALASAAGLAVFASGVLQPWNGAVQRAAVTLALAAEVVLAVRLLGSYRGASAGPCSAAHLAALVRGPRPGRLQHPHRAPGPVPPVPRRGGADPARAWPGPRRVRVQHAAREPGPPGAGEPVHPRPPGSRG
ncbi:MAG TPA: DUF998 domain-containing protein [Streptosporangiaceae bacterium]|nr:DUF998 domain-containing protein [Streptosporangiaceae bacterium]